MKLFIEDKDKLNKYILPKEAQDSFLIIYKPENSKQEYSINIESNEGKWLLRSNGMVNVLENGVIVNEAPLEEYYSYVLQINGSDEQRIIYCLPFIEEKSMDASVFGVSQITIGNSLNCNICYNNPNLEEIHALITRENNSYVLTANFPGVYLNTKPVQKTILTIGDSIFIRGLKIIWMNNFVRICNSSVNTSINFLSPYKEIEKYDNTNYGGNEEKDIYMELYDEKEYFYHTPRIRNYLTKEKIKIDEPPQEDKIDKTPAILTIGASITMVSSSFMSGYTVIYGLSTGTKTIGTAIPSIIMCICILVGGLLMPRLLASYQKRQKIKKENLRQQKYSEYLKSKGSELQKILYKQSAILNNNFPDCKECYNIVMNRKQRLWEKGVLDDDFLELSVGYGTTDAKIEINAPEEKFVLEEDNLRTTVTKLAEQSKKLNNVPITYSLLENRLSSIICSMTYKDNYINNIILQLITFQSALDLKLVFLLEHYNEDKYDYAKYLPHVLSEDKKARYFASNFTDIKEVCEKLELDYKERYKYVNTPNKENGETIDKKDKYKNFDSYYLIITDCYNKIKDINFIKNIIKSNDNYGYSMLFIEDGLTDLPPECETFVYAKDKGSYMVKPKDEENESIPFVPRTMYINMKPVVYKLANIPIAAKEGKKELPKSMSFLEMYNVSKIEQLNVAGKWKENNPVISLKAPIGVHADRELFMLDLHEKAHGPHGLIAGSTGSGKSEFIITFILSMAINYNPDEVQFVLIDYKGGGLAGAFENRETGISLPHLAGTITNLDTAEMNRTLVSINSELKRRQKMFNEVRDRLGEGTIDIYKYQKLYREGLIDEPIAHLFIISDEFAELKSQQPEFMQELISTSRIGRSLGVHLILATQKPSGVVNDQIWANSRFKVCLKVQDRSDSMEMLKRPEAASIKEPGRFYLQVGYDEYFELGQSGYSGAVYIPSDTIVKKVDNNISYVSNIGNEIKSINDDDKSKMIVTEAKGDQLTNTVKYIISVAKKQKIKIKKLWLNSIPENITAKALAEKYDYEAKPYYINPIIGEYDNPSKQEQGLLTLDLTGKGHSLIYGMPGSGKENLITTMVANTCEYHSPEEVNFYLLDFGAETLRIFNKYPHVGVVATADEQQKIMDTFVMIDEEAGRRRELFADYAGSYQNYINESGNKLPLIVVVINGYEVFIENFPRIADAIYPLIREGLKYGISFVVTTATNGAVRMRTAQLFNNKLTLQQNNPEDYRGLVGSPRGLTPKKFFGRGLVATDDGAFEFQTAYYTERVKLNENLRELSKELQDKYKKHAKRIMNMPDVVTTELLKDEIDNLQNVPIGIEKESKDTYHYNFDAKVVTNIISNSIEDKVDFIYGLTNILKLINNTQVTIIDAAGLINNSIENVTIEKDNFDLVLSNMIKEINKEADGIKRIFIIIGLSRFKQNISNIYISYFDSLFANINKFNNTRIIIVDDTESYKNNVIEPWYSEINDNQNGIWLGENPNNQIYMNFDSLSIDDKKDNYKYLAFGLQDGKPTNIKYVVEGDNNGQ